MPRMSEPRFRRSGSCGLSCCRYSTVFAASGCSLSSSTTIPCSAGSSDCRWMTRSGMLRPLRRIANGCLTARTLESSLRFEARSHSDFRREHAGGIGRARARVAKGRHARADRTRVAAAQGFRYRADSRNEAAALFWRRTSQRQPCRSPAEDMAALEETLLPEKVAGPRYSERQMAQVDR
jgi:hypothetical protein